MHALFTPLLLLLPLTLALPSTPQSSTPQSSPPPYIGLTAHISPLSAPCSTTDLDFNLRPPTTWLSQPASAHCFPGVPGAIHNITCITRRLTPLPADNGLDTKAGELAKCDFRGFTEVGCQGKYWVASQGTPGADGNGGSGEGWYWTDEEVAAGPELLDVRSWQIDCGA